MDIKFPLPREWTAVAQATGLLLAHFACEVDDAELLLVRAARQAGVGLVALADDLLSAETRHAALATVAAVAWSPSFDR